ncbi:MAG: hypothetical protein SFW09_15690 [Hyphomicrobiaceae bacterium]|nr:hypothetical protein [Hyphomicrobiaceae bacterium]
MRNDRLLSVTPGARLNASGTVSLRPTDAYQLRPSRIRRWLRLVGSRIAVEHRCAMPAGFTVAVASHLMRDDGTTHACAECGQVFAKGGVALDPGAKP